MSEENSLGNRIKKARERLHWTQDRLADELQISRTAVNRWEKGKQRPSGYYRRKLFSLLGLDEKEDDIPYETATQVLLERHNLSLHNLPPKNDFFTGRKTHLDQIGELLQENGAVGITQAISISGLGGIGKTQLALEYAYRHLAANTYRAVLWVNAADETTLRSSYDELLRKVNLPEQKERDAERQVQAVKQWLEEHRGWLLIMDNADDLPFARSFLPSILLGHVLFTTRSQIVRDSGITAQVQVEEMELEEGLRFLLRRSGKLQPDSTLGDVAADVRETALQLVELLGGLPLALDQAGAYIEETSISFADYIKRYQKERRDLLDRRKARVSRHSEHPESVFVTIKLSFQKACELHRLAGDILNFCAFLQPDAMAEELLQYDDSSNLGPTIFNEAIAALRRYSLVKRNAQEKTLSIHRLVQAVLIDSMDADLQMYWKERVGRALNVYFPRSDFRSGNWTLCDRYLLHVISYAAWTKNDPTPAVEVGELYDKAGSYALSRWWFPVAEDLLPRAHASFAQHYGDWHPDTMRVLTTVASVYENEQAETILLQLISAQTEQLGLTHRDTFWSMWKLAGLYIEQGAYEEAEKIVNQLSDLLPERWEYKYLLEEHLVAILLKQGKYEQAEPLLRQKLDILEKNGETGFPRIPEILYQIGMCLIDRKEYKEAALMYARALHIQEPLYGVSNPDLQKMRRAIAES